MVTQLLDVPALCDSSVFSTAIVPVTEVGDSFGSLRQALRLPRSIVGAITLIGLLPPAVLYPDPDVVRAVLAAAEAGYGLGRLVPPLGEDEREAQIWRSVLWPLRRQTQAAGLPAHAFVLRGERCSDGIRRYAVRHGGCIVMLGQLDRWYADLDQVARDLLLDPPCAVRIAPSEPRSLSALRRLAAHPDRVLLRLSALLRRQR